MRSTKPTEKITSYHIDPENDNNAYIATSVGHLFLWNWVDGKLVQQWNLGLPSLEFISLSVDEKPESEEFVGTVYAAECTQKSGTLWRIRLPKNPETAVEKASVYENTVDRISAAQVLDGGRIAVVIAGRTLAVGNKHVKGQEGKSKWGVFRKYPMTFHLACMDAFLPIVEASESGKGKKGKKARSANGDLLGDVVIGDDTGAMHLFHNVLRLKEGTNSEPVIRKLHWHRKKVRSVKWALDGMFNLIPALLVKTDHFQATTSFPVVLRPFSYFGRSKPATNNSSPILDRLSNTSSSPPVQPPTPSSSPTTRS